MTRSPSSIISKSVIAFVVFLAIRASSGCAVTHARQFTGTSSRFTVAGQVSRARDAAPAAPSRAARSRIVDQPPERARKGVGVGVDDEAGALVRDELGRATAVVTRDHRPGRRKGLHRHEPVVLVERREHDGAAAREVIDELLLVEPAWQADAIARAPALARVRRPRRALSPSPASTARMSAASGCASASTIKRIRFSGVNRDTAEQVRLVVVHAVRPLRRRRVQAPPRSSSGHAASRCRTVSEITNSFETLRVSR